MEKSRRKFIKDMTALGLFASTVPILSSFEDSLKPDYVKEKINKIELFRYDVDIPRYFSWGTWYNRQHLFMKITSGDYYGWSEIPASLNNPDFYPTEWIEYLRDFMNLTIDQAYKLLHSQQVKGTKVKTKKLEFIEMALLDLSGRMQNKPAIELLHLNGNKPVPGLYCILDNDIEKVRREALESIEQKLSHHVKFKMYGIQQVDLTLLKTIRETIGESAYVISDVNAGYKEWKTLSELEAILNEFKENGLNAIEDPAKLTTDEWIKLQQLVGELSLIPDYPMRPSWEGLENMKPGMGKIYNLHPSTMGSFRLTALMANKIKEMGYQVMIGDDSLVGPACSAWQQIAVGAGASWVEAVEKKGDSKKYLTCILSSPTKLDEKGNIAYTSKPGFGLELDTKRLKEISTTYVDLR